jgi:hypothetical protein
MVRIGFPSKDFSRLLFVAAPASRGQLGEIKYEVKLNARRFRLLFQGVDQAA